MIKLHQIKTYNKSRRRLHKISIWMNFCFPKNGKNKLTIVMKKRQILKVKQNQSIFPNANSEDFIEYYS